MATTTGAGRPRLSTKKRPGETAREEILDAAAELFTTRGFTNTSTRMIADAVGIRQASLYHHFAGKDDMLDALLSGTVDEPLAVGRQVESSDASASVKMYALALFDADQLTRSTWNLGALYLLPEVRADRFESFRRHRYALMDLYASLASSMLGELGADALPGTQDLPFRLVETVVNGRADVENGRVASTAWSPALIADAAVRVLGWTGSTESLRSGARILTG
ncbi:TetR/AcrR family transcriptional regulator [Rhodococcoides kyotonense]|uniref:DNA-binding transcriptional regulator, AcrR family n=1 Tax=Rhodococcoides kyotonense TaxID=398843 RepID=A0A239KJJ8_9NOCA|nr:TetR/AcrR family transcriptional regulator [Rhodococcus kyotonensis]SNT18225.1 DNA-binding transcriptional regulator, AcrR family [Rhodococcus kyotonensis]